MSTLRGHFLLIKNNLITFRPFEIKIINNVACVRSFNTFDQQLHFYNLPNFTIQSTYKDFHQPISVIQNSFYQDYKSTSFMYVYNNKIYNLVKLNTLYVM